MRAKIIRRRRRRQWLLWKAQRFRCAGCGERIYHYLRGHHPRRVTIDEVVPKALGGRAILGNQVVMHLACNGRKADRKPNGCELIWLHMVNARLSSKGKLALEVST